MEKVEKNTNKKRKIHELNLKTWSISEKRETSEAVEELTPYEKLVGTIKSHNKSIAKKVLAKSHKILEKTEEVGGGSGEEKTWKPDAENSPDVGEEETDEHEDVGDDEEDDIQIGEDQNLSEDEFEDNRHGQDPFKVHFCEDLTDELVQELIHSKPEMKETKSLVLGTVQQFVPVADVPTVNLKYEAGRHCLDELKIKAKLASKWKDLDPKKTESFSALQGELFSFINNYQDVFFAQRDFANGEQIRRLYCLHALNHVLKTRTKVLKNNARLVQAQKEGKEIVDVRDQGLTRPKILILVPFRDACLKIVNCLIRLAVPLDGKGQVMQKKRFYQEFQDDSEETRSKVTFIPDDFKALFTGNTDDCFRIGISFARNTIKLYADFYSADIIIASPLGLRTIIGADGEKDRDFDFLSSIEVLIMDQADVFLMQNWEHATHVLEHLHLRPKELRDTDFSRVRMWTVNEWSKYYRQTLIFSSFTTPEINAIFNRHCNNYAGKIKIKETLISGSVRQVVSQIPQIFHKVSCSCHSTAADVRFQFFVEKVLPNLTDGLSTHVAIFIPSYFDFVRLRNYFKKEELNFAQINEYSKRSNISKTRIAFLQGKKKFLLFTERFYFFYRYRIKGIHHIVFYQLPTYPIFYPEIINYMDSETMDPTCTTLYTKFDGNKLERTVGTQKCKQMLSSSKNVQMIVTEE